MASVVVYGTGTNRYTDSVNGTSEIYNQLYPFEGLDNYTSGIIHHVRMTGTPGRPHSEFSMLVLASTLGLR